MHLKHRSQFSRVQRSGVRFRTEHFTVSGARNSDVGEARLGCAVSKKAGNAVRRNRLRRLFRELVREFSKHEVDFVISAGEYAAGLERPSLRTVGAELRPAIKKVIERVAGIRSTTIKPGSDRRESGPARSAAEFGTRTRGREPDE